MEEEHQKKKNRKRPFLEGVGEGGRPDTDQPGGAKRDAGTDETRHRGICFSDPSALTLPPSLRQNTPQTAGEGRGRAPSSLSLSLSLALDPRDCRASIQRRWKREQRNERCGYRWMEGWMEGKDRRLRGSGGARRGPAEPS